jgi:hypothetical protein
MVLKALFGIVDIKDSADFLHSITCEPVSNMTFHQVLLKYLKMSDGHFLIAKVHQANPQLETIVIVPNTPVAKCLIVTMNKKYCCLSLAYAH